MSGETAADQRLPLASLAERAVKALPAAILASIPILRRNEGELAAVLPLLAIPLAIAVLAALLPWRRFRYGIGPAGIAIESGVFTRRRRTIPLARIQDVAIERGPIARLLGLAKVRVETGGGAADEGLIDSIALARAHAVRDTLRRIRSDEPAAAGTEAPPPLFAMIPRRVLLAGLYAPSFLFIAAAGAALQYLEPFLGIDPFDPRRIFGQRERASALIGGLSPTELAALAAVAILLGILTGLALTLTRFWNFRLWRAGPNLRRSQGLLTQREAVIPLARVQALVLRTTPLMRRSGWHRLELQTLGAETGGGRLIAAPFARMEEIAPILRQVREAPLPAHYHPVSRRHVARLATRYIALLALVTLALLPLTRAALALLLLAPALVALARLQWRRHGYAVEGGALHVRSGVFRQRLWVVPLARAQAIARISSPFQRRAGLATLVVDTAGAPRFDFARILDLSADDAERLAALIAATKQPAPQPAPAAAL